MCIRDRSCPRFTKNNVLKHPDTWLVGTKETSGVVFSPHNRRNQRQVGGVTRKWKSPVGATRMLLQQPMERPCDVPPIVWEHFHDAFTRVATTPRERKAHESTLWLTDPAKRGMVLDGVATTMGNGANRRFQYC
eukprot:TRINITY_DN27204_c0_g1_i1.p1 TRINITY_DN27204_c0_g1~~TRINITY_DN27204_c0_g1_i1.p1  ORF type:complete len:134 (-),score=19.32 TRINITY_DN27204_c0_g1_i1:141-542(-)